jgi:hypothetical protein
MGMSKKRRSIPQIIADAGGPHAISAALNGAVTPDAVTKWPRIGIPDRHWIFIIPLAKSSADEMMAANLAARSVSDFNNLEQTS